MERTDRLASHALNGVLRTGTILSAHDPPSAAAPCQVIDCCERWAVTAAMVESAQGKPRWLTSTRDVMSGKLDGPARFLRRAWSARDLSDDHSSRRRQPESRVSWRLQ